MLCLCTQLESAIEWFKKALALNPEYHKAAAWARKVEHEVARAASGIDPSRLVMEARDATGTKFEMKFRGGTIVI